MIASAIKHGTKLPNVATAHTALATGGDDGRCLNERRLPPLYGRSEPADDTYEYPTTVIAKRDGYGQCGVLVPNP